jgi:hypothetical protein
VNWDGLFIYTFWLMYFSLCYILWKYSDRIYFWFFSEMVEETEGNKDVSS